MINVAVIDDGINEEYYNMGKLHYDIEIQPELSIVYRKDTNRFLPSHGTTCAGIIRKYTDSQINLSSIKILNDNSRGLVTQLVEAVRWCIENNITVLNLSLGSIDFKDFNGIRHMVNRAYHEGIIMVAACNNKNIYTYPASFSNVIGVRCDLDNRLGEHEYLFYPGAPDGIEICAFSKHKLIRFDGVEEILSPANSYAAPYITAVVCNILNSGNSLSMEQIKLKLKDNSVNSCDAVYNPYIVKSVEWADEIAFVGPGQIAKESLELIKDAGFIKMGSEELLWNMDDGRFSRFDEIGRADTLVVSESDCKFYENSKQLKQFIEIASMLKKNMIILDNNDVFKTVNLDLSEIGIKLWHSSGFDCMKRKYTNIFSEETPVITVVYSFEHKCLKLLNYLKCRFENDGYNSIAASVWTLGVLMGIMYFPQYKMVNEINDYVNNFKKVYNPDILIIGLGGIEGVTDLPELGRILDSDMIIHMDEEEKSSGKTVRISALWDHDGYETFKNYDYFDIEGFEENYSMLYGYIIDLFNSGN